MVWVSLLVKEFKILSRDRHALLLLFLMPAAFIVTLSLALKNVFEEKIGIDLSVLVNRSDESELAQEIERLLNIQRGIAVVSGKSSGSSNSERSPNVRAIMSIPQGFGDATLRVIGGKNVEKPLKLSIEFDPVLDGAYRQVLRSSLTIALQTAILTVMGNAVSRDVDLTKVDYEQLHEEKAQTLDQKIPNPAQQNVPAWSLFAMFFIVLPISNNLMRERDNGILQRLAAFSVNPWIFFAAKQIPYIFINVLQFAVMLLVGLGVIPMLMGIELSIGPQSWMLIPVTFAAAIAATSFGLFVACWTRTSEQASALGAVSVVIMAALGGIMVPHFVMPDFMQKLAYLSPLYWGLQAYLDVLLRGIQFVYILPKILVLLGFAVCCQVASVFKFKWNDTAH